MIKENLRLGKITYLKTSEKIVLEALLKSEKTYYQLSTRDIRLMTALSESAVTKAVRDLKERGLLVGSKGNYKIANKTIVRKLQEDD
jgi:biotin operon repressor